MGALAVLPFENSVESQNYFRLVAELRVYDKTGSLGGLPRGIAREQRAGPEREAEGKSVEAKTEHEEHGRNSHAAEGRGRRAEGGGSAS